MDTSQGTSEIPGKFEMLCWRGTERISWINRVKKEQVLHSVKDEMNIVHTVKRRKCNGIGHIWRRDCLLKYGKGRKKRSGGKTRKT